LGGSIDELRIIVQNFDQDAARSKLDRTQALGLMEKNAEPFIRDQAGRMKENTARLNRLQEQQVALKIGGSLNRILIVAFNSDPQLYQRTQEDFQASLRLDGVLLGMIGFALSFLAMLAAASIFLVGRNAAAQK